LAKKIGRIEAITDGVFAICLTLLVLEIKIPHPAIRLTDTQILKELSNILPKIAVYFMSFLTIGLFWLGHPAQLHLLEKTDGRLAWINLFFLFFVSLIPFSTSFLGKFSNSIIAGAMYWFNLLLMGITIFFHWAYAKRKEFVSVENIAAADNPIKRRILL
jgi:uncharacterized membrane protein